MKNRYNLSEYTRIIATIEKSDGNDSVGNMWTETKGFPISAPLEEVFKWANESHCTGKLILTIDQSSKISDLPF